MKLAELDPIWISLGGHGRKSGFIFKCPHCRQVWLICKAIPADFKEQVSVMSGCDLGGLEWVPAGAAVIWQWFGGFPDLTVSPSIDASKSGHWHGHIAKGDIVS